MKNLKKNLQTVDKDLKALSKKVDTMIVAVDKFGKPKPKTVKAKPVKKTVAKAKPVEKIVAKKVARLTATDTVLNIIKRYKKGVGIPILKTKSGFNDKKVRNIVQKAFKEGKIKRVGKGIYIKA